MRAILRKLSLLSVANATNGLLGLVFVPVALSRLGGPGYGVYSIYAVIAGYVALLDLGIGRNLLREIAAESRSPERRRILQLTLGLYVFVAGALVVLLPLTTYLVSTFVFPVSESYRGALRIIVVLATLEYVVGVPAAIMRNWCVADERFNQYSAFVAISGVVRYSLSFGAVLLFQRPEVVVGVIVSRRVGDVLLARRIMGGPPAGSWQPRFDLREFRATVGQSSLLSVARLLQVTVVATGSVLVNYTFGLRSLGVYRSVFDLASKMWFFSNTLGIVIFPRFVRLLQTTEGRSRLQVALPAALSLSWVMYASIALAVILLGPVVLPLIGMSGAEFESLLVVLIAGVCFHCHASVAFEFTQAAGRYRTAMGLAAMSLALMTGVFWSLKGSAGLNAIGWAWLVSQLVYAYVADANALMLLGVSGTRVRGWALPRLAALTAVMIAVFAAIGVVATASWLVVLLFITGGIVLSSNNLRTVRSSSAAV